MSHWNNRTTPTGDYIELRENIKLPFKEPLLELVFSEYNLKRAWQQVRSNKGSAGVDGVSVDQSPVWAKQYWQQYKTQLLNGRYRP